MNTRLLGQPGMAILRVGVISVLVLNIFWAGTPNRAAGRSKGGEPLSTAFQKETATDCNSINKGPAKNIGPASSDGPDLMPPHPRLVDCANRGDISLPQLTNSSSPQKSPGMLAAAAGSSPVRGTWRALALLVQFTDQPARVGASSFDSLLFGTTGSTMRNYYNTVSYGQLDIVTVNLPSSTGWMNMPQPYSAYAAGAYGYGNYPNNAQKMAEDAVRAADPLVDFSQYDNDGDGYVDTIFIIHSGPGSEFTNNPNDIWSHSWHTVNTPVVDGKKVYSYTTEPEFWVNPGDLTMGVYAHELGHVFGLPDLYDTDNSSAGVGYWSLMGYGSWNGPYPGGSSPAFLDAWSRIKLGFVTPKIVSSNILGVQIPAAENSPTIFRLWTNGGTGNEYYLVENRQPTGYDAYLPGSGLLIWHIDDSKSGDTAECFANNNWECPGHYQVALEQADGQWALEHKSNGGDAGDPFPGSTGSRNFSFNTLPGSSAYNGSSATFIGVNNIGNSADPITADLMVSDPAVPTQPPAPRVTPTPGVSVFPSGPFRFYLPIMNR